MPGAWLIVLTLLLGCGAKTGIETPPACEVTADCPIAVAFCLAQSICLDGFCALAEPPDCTDDSACTIDTCDGVLAMCIHTIRDRDMDGFLDASCGGDDCDDLDPAIHPGATEQCMGGVDEDCDGTFDCSDLDCEADPACVGCDPERCEGGLDEDCDGLIDCGDSDCRCCEDRELRCDDGLDDDCDGDIDCLDSDCALSPLCCVPSPEVCNGLDDDCDGVADDGVTCFFLDGTPVTALATTACGADYYRYDSPATASGAPVPDLRRSGRVAVAIVDMPASCEGPAVVVIADQVEDGSGGMLEGRFVVDRDGVGGIVVGDEPTECSWSGRTGRCGWRWQPCCTDGVLIGRLGPNFCLALTIDSASGVSSMALFDADLVSTPLSFGVPFELCARTVPSAP